MKTPQEKAKELVKKFEDENLHFEDTIKESAKYYASICVDEILSLKDDLWGKPFPSAIIYWQEVRKQIILL